VLSVDVLSREIISRPIERFEGEEQQHQHILKTSRLILKRGTLPKWAPKGVIRNAESWVLEESEVELDPIDPTSALREDRKGKGREMKSWTRNLDHTTVMAVTELNIFRERLQRQGVSATAQEDVGGGGGSAGTAQVGLKSTFDVTSGVTFGLLRDRIEKFGLNRVLTHIDTVSIWNREDMKAYEKPLLSRRVLFCSLDRVFLILILDS